MRGQRRGSSGAVVTSSSSGVGDGARTVAMSADMAADNPADSPADSPQLPPPWSPRAAAAPAPVAARLEGSQAAASWLSRSELSADIARQRGSAAAATIS